VRSVAIVISIVVLVLPCAAQLGPSDDGRGTNLPAEGTAPALHGTDGHAGWAQVAKLVARGEAGPAPAWIGERYWRDHHRDDQQDRVELRIVYPRYRRLWPAGPAPWAFGWRTLWDPWWGPRWHAFATPHSHRGDPWVPYRF
jgi:hypothetical protein